jgi:uncharacterized protein (DUF924 family)
MSQVTDKFGPLVDAALAGQLGEEWEATPRAAVAKMVLLDQLPRNMYRGSAKAFAGDQEAVRIIIITLTRTQAHIPEPGPTYPNSNPHPRTRTYYYYQYT